MFGFRLNWLQGVGTALAVLPFVVPAANSVIEAVEEKGLVGGGAAKKQAVLNIINGAITTGDAFVDGIEVTPAQRHGIQAVASVSIDALVTYKNAVGLFRRSDEKARRAEPLAAADDLAF